MSFTTSSGSGTSGWGCWRLLSRPCVNGARWPSGLPWAQSCVSQMGLLRQARPAGCRRSHFTSAAAWPVSDWRPVAGDWGDERADTVSVADVGFILAVGALGWGLSLVTYRAFATQRRWPMGAWHTRVPQVPIAIGAMCMVLAVWVATQRIGERRWRERVADFPVRLGLGCFLDGISARWCAKRPAAGACRSLLLLLRGLA